MPNCYSCKQPMDDISPTNLLPFYGCADPDCPACELKYQEEREAGFYLDEPLCEGGGMKKQNLLFTIECSCCGEEIKVYEFDFACENCLAIFKIEIKVVSGPKEDEE